MRACWRSTTPHRLDPLTREKLVELLAQEQKRRLQPWNSGLVAIFKKKVVGFIFV